jgi:phage virion morphogenesis family
MDAKQIANIIARAPKQVEAAMRDEIPRKAAVVAKNHFMHNFDESGFVDGGLRPWKKTRRQEAGDPRKPLTSNRNHLMNSIDVVGAPGLVTVVNPVPYARIHNEGGTIHSQPTITPKMRKMAWAKAYSIAGVSKGGKLPKDLPEEARKWRALALTKKEKLNIKIKMPRRQFIGDSKELRVKINKIIIDKLKNISNGITTR